MEPNKLYSKTICYFCDNIASYKNNQGMPVCRHCKEREIEERCPVCRSFMDVKDGKFGAYFYCYLCNKSWNPGLVKHHKVGSCLN